MLFSVKYIGANIEEFHNVLIYFFRELETNNHAVFSENLFPANCRTKLYKYGNVANGYKKFVDSFQEIFAIYTAVGLTAENKQQIIDDFFLCNEIENICSDITINPIHYDDMDVEVKKVANYFNSFYDKFFEDFVERQKHIEAFQSENGNVCPICGLHTSYQYDHFIPKGTDFPIYPFSSVNPKNLIRICQACNGPKSSRLVIYLNSDRNLNRLLAFSPYSGFNTWENLDFELTNISKPEVNNSGKWNVSLTPKNNGISAENILKIKCWKEFFSIEERFSKEIELRLKNWILNFKMIGKTFDEMIVDTKPTIHNIKYTNGILLQNLLFKFIASNNDILDQFVTAESTAEDPINLLLDQEQN